MRFYNRQPAYDCGVDLHVKTMYVCRFTTMLENLLAPFTARPLCGGVPSAFRWQFPEAYQKQLLVFLPFAGRFSLAIPTRPDENGPQTAAALSALSLGGKG